MPSPVVLFAFNRPEALRRTLDALSLNDLASETDLFIHMDGPRGVQDLEKVAAVRSVAMSARGFRKVELLSSESNRGLAPSIIAGVGQVLESYDRVIVMEDDLVAHPGFLAFLNAGLERYENESEVFSVCGYTNAVRMPADYRYDAYFCPRSSSWGWATWRNRWESVDWAPAPSVLQELGPAFNRWGGSDCASMLHDWMEGRNSSWAIRFCFSQFQQGKVSAFPVESLIDPSAGFSGEGTHCKSYNRFRFRMAPESKRTFVLPPSVTVIPRVRRRALMYHSLLLRAWTRFMNLFYA